MAPATVLNNDICKKLPVWYCYEFWVWGRFMVYMTPCFFLCTTGMACLALFQQDGLWYRARVESLLGNSQVEVLYVDYGNKERVSVPALLKIPDKFMRLPSQAIQVSLADVAPTSGKGWPNEVRTWASDALLLSRELSLL